MLTSCHSKNFTESVSDSPNPKVKFKKINRSIRLKKYAIVYKSYFKKTEQSKTSKSPRRIRKTTPGDSKTPRETRSATPKKSLNAYQKFVQLESKKEKYKNLPGKERLSIIADTWKKRKIL